MGIATQNTENLPDRYERFCEVYQYAEVVKKLAKEFNLPFLSLQEKLTEAAVKTKAEYYLVDGVHPNVAGATLIADEWVKLFKKEIENNKRGQKVVFKVNLLDKVIAITGAGGIITQEEFDAKKKQILKL